jgi:hypothetical protein
MGSSIVTSSGRMGAAWWSCAYRGIAHSSQQVRVTATFIQHRSVPSTIGVLRHTASRHTALSALGCALDVLVYRHKSHYWRLFRQSMGDPGRAIGMYLLALCLASLLIGEQNMTTSVVTHIASASGSTAGSSAPGHAPAAATHPRCLPPAGAAAQCGGCANTAVSPVCARVPGAAGLGITVASACWAKCQGLEVLSQQSCESVAESALAGES